MGYIDKAIKAGLGVLVVALIVKLLMMPSAAIINEPLNNYDFIIVGAGSAGSVLSARLSQQYSVLLIEAGDEFSWISQVPLAAPFLQSTVNDWQYRTKPQKYSSFGLVDRVSFWPRGKGLGGSGQMNYLVHYAGTKQDWSEISQDWAYPVMSHYMAKLKGKPYRPENFQKTQRAVCEESPAVAYSHKTCQINTTKLFLNVLNISHHKCPPFFQASLSRHVRQEKPSILLHRENVEKNAILKALLGAGKELKHLRLKIAAGESTIRNGRRWSSYDSHLSPAMHSNQKLHVLKNSIASKILFHDKQARAVAIKTNTGDFHVTADKEIILSAGAIGTPQLLQLSGIGPKKLLAKHKIDVVADLPIGENLYDHLNIPLYISLEKPVSWTLDKILKISQVIKYLLLGKGPFGQSAVVGTVTADDVGLLFFGMGSTEEKLFRVISNYDYQTFNALFPKHRNHSSEGFIILASCLKPESRGFVHIINTDPTKPPEIDPRYLENDKDINCTKKAIQLARRLLLTKPFQQLGAKLHLPQLPTCPEFQANIHDDDYMDCFIRTSGITSYHPGGTVSMHTSLDSLFRLKQTTGLRVVDSSAIPIPQLGAPNSLLLTIADRLANLILTQHNTTKPQKRFN